MGVYKRKSWVEKRDLPKEHAVKKLTSSFADIKEGETMLVPTPRLIDDYIRQIPKGKFVSLQQIRKDLAAANGSDKTCPVTSGIFLRIVAEAAAEELASGKPVSKVTPFWRVVAPASPLAKKLSFGTDLLSQMQLKEKISLLQKT